jgi:hypothetical protein
MRAVLRSGLIHNNTASGAVVTVLNSSTLALERTNFTENGSGMQQGVLHAASGSRLDVVQSVFAFNNASAWGGAITMQHSKATVNNSTFRGNRAEQGGGAMHVDDSSTVSVCATHFLNNAAPKGGAIMVNNKSTMTLLTDVLLEHNTAGIHTPGYAHVSDDTLGVGGALWISASTVTVRDARIEVNQALREGGEVSAAGAPAPDLCVIQFACTNMLPHLTAPKLLPA